MKQNTISVSFTQLIAAKVVNLKNAAKEIIGTKEVPARTIEVSFTESTDKEVNAKNLAQYFLGRLVAWQKLRPLQGKEGFQTSKLMTVSLKVNNKELSSEMKFTVNPDRIEKCLQRSENLVALIAQAASAPKFGAPEATVRAYLMATPQNVVLAKSKKAQPVLIEESVPTAEEVLA